VASVDTKKKELVGPFKNGGREWAWRRVLRPLTAAESTPNIACRVLFEIKEGQ
jgi:hypothetical protein